MYSSSKWSQEEWTNEEGHKCVPGFRGGSHLKKSVWNL